MYCIAMAFSEIWGGGGGGALCCVAVVLRCWPRMGDWRGHGGIGQQSAVLSQHHFYLL